jgi:hypothetical protein
VSLRTITGAWLFVRCPQVGTTIAVLGFFALLVANGMSDSANVALGIFVLHVGTLAALVISSIVYIASNDGGWVAVGTLPCQPTWVLVRSRGVCGGRGVGQGGGLVGWKGSGGKGVG